MKNLIPTLLTLSLLLLSPSAGQACAESAATDGIRLPLHALTLAMVENDLAYDAASDEFVWLALSYTLSMYGQTDLRAQYTDEALVLPSECAEDFFHALFARRAHLPPIPASMSGRIAYDPAGDEYRLALGDFGLSEIVLSLPCPVSDGIWALDGLLRHPEDGATLCRFTVTLAENESMFGCSVMDMAIV